MIATGLGKISTSRYSQLDTQVLEDNCHQVRNHDDRQKGVAKPCAPSQIRCPIARIHIAHGDQKSRTGEGDQFPPERCRPRHNNAAMNLWQGDLAARFSPGHARFWCNCDIVLCHQLRFSLRLLRTVDLLKCEKSPVSYVAGELVSAVLQQPAKVTVREYVPQVWVYSPHHHSIS